MSYAATQKQHHIHVPWMPVIAVAVAVAVAAAVLILVNQPGTQTSGTRVETAPATVAAVAAVPVPETLAFRRHLAQQVATRVAQEDQFAYPRNHVIGTTLAASGAAVLGGHLAMQAAPNDPHPLNHFPSQP
jgi:hypothetical protein